MMPGRRQWLWSRKKMWIQDTQKRKNAGNGWGLGTWKTWTKNDFGFHHKDALWNIGNITRILHRANQKFSSWCKSSVIMKMKVGTPMHPTVCSAEFPNQRQWQSQLFGLRWRKGNWAFSCHVCTDPIALCLGLLPSPPLQAILQSTRWIPPLPQAFLDNRALRKFIRFLNTSIPHSLWYLTPICLCASLVTSMGYIYLYRFRSTFFQTCHGMGTKAMLVDQMTLIQWMKLNSFWEWSISGGSWSIPFFFFSPWLCSPWRPQTGSWARFPRRLKGNLTYWSWSLKVG